jgi:hypothetical protein
LDGLYAAKSQASAMQLRMQLAPMKKNELSATDYFNWVKNLADNLAAAGAPLREDEIVAYILTRLLGEYDSLVTFVTTRAEPMSLSEVYTNLLSFEARLCEPQCPPLPPVMAIQWGPTTPLVVAITLVALVVALVVISVATLVVVLEAVITTLEIATSRVTIPGARSVVVKIIWHRSVGISMMMATRWMRSLPQR